jgi:hypothetical protein
MGFWQDFKNWIASLRRAEGLDLPDAGRSSEETLGSRLSSYANQFGSVSPVIDWDMLATLKRLWLFNPDFSQYVANLVNLGNPGHDLLINAKTAQAAEQVTARLNELATRAYQNGAGVDGLLNAYVAQIAWSGALSSEDVVDFAGRRISEVVLVPVETIRFRYEEGEYRPYQRGRTFGAGRTAFGLIPLNPNTYRYYALQTVENSPYAKPPATAAVETIVGAQKDIHDNISWIAKKLGVLGLVAVSVTEPRRKSSETDEEYRRRCTDYLKRVTASLDGNFNKGLVVAFRDQKISHDNVAGNAQGAYDVNRMVEEQVMSGLAMQPAFFGRTDSTTETYADVVYNLLLAQVANVQRLAKRRQEQSYRLDLRLGGLAADSISVKFHKAHARDVLKEAQARQIEQTMVLERARAGVISPDEAAQELGYDSAFDPDLMNAAPDVAASLRAAFGAETGRQRAVTVRFDRAGQRYRYVPERIEADVSELIEQATNVIPLKKKAV